MWVHPIIETSNNSLSPLRARAPDPDRARAGAAYQRRLLPVPTAHPNIPTLLGAAPAPPAGRRQRRPAPEDRRVEEAHGKGRHGGEEDAGGADEGG